MRVAMTGATGFLGRSLQAALHTAGHATLRIARHASGDLVAPSAEERADAFVHLAFPTDASERRAKPTEALRSVVRAAGDAAVIAERLGATRFVLASTGKVYGRVEADPISDDTPARPTTQLGELKRLAEEIVGGAARAAGFSATALRVFNAYGEGQPPTFLVPTLLDGVARGELALGELHHARDWIHVTDVARAFVVALEASAGTRLRVWSVGSGVAHDVAQLLEVLRKLGANVPNPMVDARKLRPGEATSERAACEGLRALGWSPEVALERGLADLYRHGLRRRPLEPVRS